MIPPDSHTPPSEACFATFDLEGRRRIDLYRNAAAVLTVALGYYAGTRIGFALTPSNEPIAVFWPPNAILLAGFLLAPVRLWPFILLAVLPAHFVAQGSSGIPVSTSFGWYVGNCGEALLGAALIRGLPGGRVPLDSVQGVTRFLLFGFIVAPVVTSFLDAAIVVGTNWGRDYWVLWIDRLLSNMLAQLTIVPTVVIVVQRGLSWITGRSLARWVEAALLGAAVVMVSLFVFRSESTANPGIPALIYLPLPVLLWSSLRFGPAALSASMLILSLTAIESLMHGRGPFISPSVATSVLSIQMFLCMIGVPLLLLAAVLREQTQTERSLRETSRRLIDAQEGERHRIAQELHDGIGETLTLAELELDRFIGEARHPSSRAALVKLRDQLTTISVAIWEISHGLYPSSLEYLGLAHALTRLCADLREESKLRLYCDADNVPDNLPADVSLCLYRVAQEALQNVVRHSRARTASVRLRSERGRLTLHISDDGIGFNRSPTAPGVGFARMRERLRAVHGGIDIESAPGRGTRLDAWVVLHQLASTSDREPVLP